MKWLNSERVVIMEDFKFLFKVVLVGNAGVGKTCLVRRFTQGLFPPGQGATIGVDFMIKTIDVDGEKVKVRPVPKLHFKLILQCVFVNIKKWPSLPAFKITSLGELLLYDRSRITYRPPHAKTTTTQVCSFELERFKGIVVSPKTWL